MTGTDTSGLSSPTTSRLVVGLGSVDRGDDAVGPAVASLVADELSRLGEHDVHVVVHEDPTELVELMTGYRSVVVVDAIRSGAPAGRVLVRTVTPGGQPLPTLDDPGAAGTHGLGLGHALELAKSLGRLPHLLCLVGIEAQGFERGAPMSPAVAQAVDHAVTAVIACLEEM